ncbi:uncharacterized protein LOC120993804 [Bufo bufo]|uniref:uncharacterized protein LOC120993804 n=1 Tax=Bufo bufo TaxID=8384 RepID=UPI001ABDBBBA|nr:uncharacterized protein LOC120993804 [Bufo bufo]
MEVTSGQHSLSANRYLRFNEPWLDFCIHNTLLPGSPWHQVLTKISAAFAKNVQLLPDDPKERQMIFKLVGKNFVLNYFSEYPNDPSLLHAPNMSIVEHERMEKKLKHWLWDQWKKAAEQSGCTTDEGTTDVSPEMTSFINHTFQLVENAMDLSLAQHENNEKRHFLEMDEEFVSWRSFSRKRPKSVESKDLHLAINSTETFPLSINRANQPGQYNSAATNFKHSKKDCWTTDPRIHRKHIILEHDTVIELQIPEYRINYISGDEGT